MPEFPVRSPAVAGQFYPGDPDVLRRVIREYVDGATLPEDLGTVRAVVAPHAGYVYSGTTAGYAFKALRAGGQATSSQKERIVFLLGPAHRLFFRGVALGKYSAFRTPLGDVPVAIAQVAEMVERSPLYTYTTEAHITEHCLEVELPFM